MKRWKRDIVAMGSAIYMKGVTKAFDKTVAVKDLDLEMHRGGFYGIIGPNGAGKTTTIRMIMAILFPDSGTISILQYPSALHAKNQIGYLPEERGMYRKMKVNKFLKYIALLKDTDNTNLDLHISKWLERVGLSGIETKRCEELSKGMLQRVQFVSAVIHQPELLILDEPFSGLDPLSMRAVRDVILDEHRSGTTILLSTHDMSQAEQMCEHIIMMHKGSKVLDEALSAIRSHRDPRTIQLEPIDSDLDVAPLMSLPEVKSVKHEDPSLEIVLHEGTDPSVAMRRIVDMVAVFRIEFSRPRLEDVFVRLVTDNAVPHDEEQLRAELHSACTDEVAT